MEYSIMTEKPPNTIFVSGDIGLDLLAELVHEHWDQDEDYGLIWHLEANHLDGMDNAGLWDGCPQLIFTRQPLPSNWVVTQ